MAFISKNKFFNYYLPITLIMVVIFIFSFFVWQPPKKIEAGWYASGSTWSYRKAIIIDHNKITATTTAISNFPMLFSVTDTDLKFTGSGGLVASSTGGDLVFTSSDGTTKLDHEIEYYASTTGQTIAWVEIPSLSPTVDTTIYVYYGSNTTTYQPNPTGVWDSAFKGVWHLPNGTTLTALDSTSNANNGTLSNTPTAATGKVDGAADLERGSSQQITAGTSSTLEIQNITISAWVKVESFGGTSTDEIFAKMDSVFTGGYEFGLRENAGNQFIAIAYYDGSVRGWYEASTDLSVATWYHVVGVRDQANSTIRFYLNGSADGTPAATNGTIAYVGDTARLGWQSQNQYFDGIIDEVKVSSVVRSAAWIVAEYNNQSSPSTFYSYGSKQIQNRITPGVNIRGKGGSSPSIKIRGGVKFK